jgi:hypothetical protein
MLRAPHTLERLLVTARILGHAPAAISPRWPRRIAEVGVQPLFQLSCRQAQGLRSCRPFHRFAIQIGNGLVA